LLVYFIVPSFSPPHPLSLFKWSERNERLTGTPFFLTSSPWTFLELCCNVTSDINLGMRC
jgi:hypothetical protein